MCPWRGRELPPRAGRMALLQLAAAAVVGLLSLAPGASASCDAECVCTDADGDTWDLSELGCGPPRPPTSHSRRRRPLPSPALA